MIGRQPSRRLLWSIVCAFLPALLVAPPARAFSDPFTAPNPGPGSISIQGNWQFHLGDDPNWSQPGFDDSGWEQLTATSPWGSQTHPGYAGFAWYRKRISLTGRPSRIAVLMPWVQDAYEVYWNGKKIGEFGKLPPHAWWWHNPREVVFPIGPAPLDGVLAVRVWAGPLFFPDDGFGGGLNDTPMLGSPAVLAQRISLAQTRREDMTMPRFILAGALFITGIIAMLLFLRERSELLYLWVALFLIANGLVAFQGLNSWAFGFTFLPGVVADQVTNALQDISLWMVLLTLFGFHKEKRWKRCTAVLAAVYLGIMAADQIMLKYWEYAGHGMWLADAISDVLITVLPLYLLFIVAFAMLRRPSKALLPIALTATVYGAYNFLDGISSWAWYLTHFRFFTHLNPGIPLGRFVFGIPAILNSLFFFVLLFTVARHQARERRRQTHIEGEMKSAREIQHVLIPEEMPAIPGFVIASVYKPAAEVGGDFYQVIPLPDAGGGPGALVFLGDVSGKGLKAAMTVSLIVGTLRTLADFTDDPEEILRGLNQRLLGRTQGGFTTCLAIRLEANGRAVIVNAGHLSPFCDGREVMVPGSLPLGLMPDVDYDSTTVDLAPGETLTLFTDGVLEARNAKGELYGFDRLSSLMMAGPSVREVVAAACNFGQDDDITVLSVGRVAVSAPHDAKLDLVAQISAA